MSSASQCPTPAETTFFSSVPPAGYTLTFSAPSFQTETISAFEVSVAQAVTINATLTIGNVSQSVVVEATGTQVESSTAQLGTVIGEKAVNDLPLNGRNFTQLLTLTPRRDPDQHRPEQQREQSRGYRCEHDELLVSFDQWPQVTGPRSTWWTGMNYTSLVQPYCVRRSSTRCRSSRSTRT